MSDYYTNDSYGSLKKNIADVMNTTPQKGTTLCIIANFDNVFL